MSDCAVPGCTQEAVVGLNGTWYCVDHFDRKLRELSKQMEKLGLLFGVAKHE